MQNLHFFAGANTACGFHSCFESILPPEQRRRMFFLKGGPGVGKSTLMKRFAHAAEEKGHRVEYFHCSSDPDSLDGVSLPDCGVGLMDGTAPHVYDPAVPGARDTLLSLGDFLDEAALQPQTGEILRLQREISARFSRCSRYLSAAQEVRCAAPAPVQNAEKAAELESEWCRLLPMRGGRGAVRRLYAEAFTPKGLVQATDFSLFDRRVTLELPFGASASALMERMAERAVSRGLDVICLADPLSPPLLSHVILPAHGLAFCTAAKGDVPSSRLFDSPSTSEKEQSFDRNAFELLCQRAAEQLAAAKTLHDELERLYTRCMDYAAWDKVLGKLLAILP